MVTILLMCNRRNRPFFLGMLLTDESMKVLLTHHVQTRLCCDGRGMHGSGPFSDLFLDWSHKVASLCFCWWPLSASIPAFHSSPFFLWFIGVIPPPAFLFFVFLNVKVLMLYLIGIFGVIPFIHKLERFHTVSKFILGISLIILGLSFVFWGIGRTLKNSPHPCFFSGPQSNAAHRAFLYRSLLNKVLQWC